MTRIATSCCFSMQLTSWGKTMGRSPPLLGPGVSMLCQCQALQQCVQRGRSYSTLPGCMTLPTGLHLHGDETQSTGADLRPIRVPITVLPLTLLPPARVAQPVAPHCSPWSVNQPMYASGAMRGEGNEKR